MHQELNLFENLTAAANIFIGREPLKAGPLRLIDERELHNLARPLLQQLGADFRAETPVASLSLAQMQLVEIAKALSLKARLVIMDEPTSSLTASETERLLTIISRLKAEGVGVIFISHRLAEVERCADRVIVLRDGKRVAELGRDPRRRHHPPHDRARPEDALPPAGQTAGRCDPRTGRREDGLPAGTGRQPLGPAG